MHWQPRNRHKGESDDMVVEGNSTFTKFLATIPKIWKFDSLLMDSMSGLMIGFSLSGIASMLTTALF